ncbi:unnamed protein product [Closterium sp. NIES-53]
MIASTPLSLPPTPLPLPPTHPHCRPPHPHCRPPHPHCRPPHSQCRPPHSHCRPPHPHCRPSHPHCGPHPHRPLPPSFLASQEASLGAAFQPSSLLSALHSHITLSLTALRGSEPSLSTPCLPSFKAPQKPSLCSAFTHHPQPQGSLSPPHPPPACLISPTRWSSLYTLSTESPSITASGQVAASSQVFAAASGSGPESAPCSCRLLSHQTLLWHHRLGHPCQTYML